jgi:DNA-binding transcriptional regulator YhcF (GntR family)
MVKEPPSHTLRAPFRRVADQLRSEIQDHVLRVGQQLPTQDELKTRFKVSRSTIQRALQELQEDGFIESQRGRAAVVADWNARGGAPEEAIPQLAVVSLVQHLETAFETSEHVTIDASCLTTQTLHGALERPLRRIYTGELRPKSLRMRLLLPSPSADLALPKRLDDPEDDKPLERLRRLITINAYVLRNKVLALCDSQVVPRPPEVSVEIRAVPITPVQKLYILNGSDALFGFYRVVEREVPQHQDWGNIYDVLGLSSLLFWHSRDPADPGSPSGVFVREAQEWFESLWSTIASDLKLSE